MNPHTGEIITAANLNALRESDPTEAAKFTVRLDGPEEDVRRISSAVREANRRRNKAARKARRKGRK